MVVMGHQGKIAFHKGMGLVEQVFSGTVVDTLQGHIAVGHNRYATAGALLERNRSWRPWCAHRSTPSPFSGDSAILCTQPFLLKTLYGQVAIAHNGQLVNHKQLNERILNHGVGLLSDSDSEIIAQVSFEVCRLNSCFMHLSPRLDALRAAATAVRRAPARYRLCRAAQVLYVAVDHGVRARLHVQRCDVCLPRSIW